MIGKSNGGWRRDDTGDPEDPNDVFPFEESYTDFAGNERSFLFSLHEVPVGIAVNAEEQVVRDEGYSFRDFDTHNPFLALGRLRGRIRRALATKHIERMPDGSYQLTHRTVRGRISYSLETPLFDVMEVFVDTHVRMRDGVLSCFSENLCSGHA